MISSAGTSQTGSSEAGTGVRFHTCVTEFGLAGITTWHLFGTCLHSLSIIMCFIYPPVCPQH